MLQEQLKEYHLILASGSPRRQQFFKDLGLAVEIRLKPIEEIYPEHLQGHEISDYLAVLKASVFQDELQENDILITSDTVVWHNQIALGKPRSKKEAVKMLTALSDDHHEVITSVCFTTPTTQIVVYETTKVHFKALTSEEINYYIDTFKPYDKAGSYGIQEWIGFIAVTHLEGSYFNVMGLPTHLVYDTLATLLE